VLSIEDIKAIVAPLCKGRGADRMYLFDSCARGEADENSGIDFRVDAGAIKGLFAFAGFLIELEDALGKQVDLLGTNSLDAFFLNEIAPEEILKYDKIPAS
jgi:predicted nucleotidyltransferase